MRGILALSLLTPALMAQAPAAPAVQTLAQKVAAETKVIEALKLENRTEAFQKAKALLPATKLTFDKTSLQTAFASMREWNAQIDTYRLIYNTGMGAGCFEEAKEACEKGRELAKALQVEALGAFEAYKATWVKAAEESQIVLDEIKELEAKVEATRVAKATNPKPKVTMEEANEELVRQAQVAQRLAFLRANEATYKANIDKVKTVMAPLEPQIKSLDARTREFDSSIALWDKYLKEEASDIVTKYKGDRIKYAAGLLRGVAPKPEDKEAALVSLHRAALLDPKNGAIDKRIDQLMGKAPAPIEKAAKGKKRK